MYYLEELGKFSRAVLFLEQGSRTPALALDAPAGPARHLVEVGRRADAKRSSKKARNSTR